MLFALGLVLLVIGSAILLSAERRIPEIEGPWLRWLLGPWRNAKWVRWLTGIAFLYGGVRIFIWLWVSKADTPHA
jgi:hypothetical protein